MGEEWLGVRAWPRPMRGFQRGMLSLRGRLFLFVAPLRCLERVDLHLLTCCPCFHVCGEIAISGFPLTGRIGIAGAITAGGNLDNTMTPFTLIHHTVTGTPIVSTSGFGHEGAIRSYLHALTNHGDYLRLLVIQQCDAKIEVTLFINFGLSRFFLGRLLVWVTDRNGGFEEPA